MLIKNKVECSFYAGSSRPVQSAPSTPPTSGTIPEQRGLLSSHYSSPLILFLLGLPSSIHLIQNVKLFFVMQPSILKDLDRNNSFITVPKLLSDGNDSQTPLAPWGWIHDSDLHLIISSLLFRSLPICRYYPEQQPFSKGVADDYVMNLPPENVFAVFSYLVQIPQQSLDPDGYIDNGIKATDIMVLMLVIHTLQCLLGICFQRTSFPNKNVDGYWNWWFRRERRLQHYNIQANKWTHLLFSSTFLGKFTGPLVEGRKKYSWTSFTLNGPYHEAVLCSSSVQSSSNSMVEGHMAHSTPPVKAGGYFQTTLDSQECISA